MAYQISDKCVNCGQCEDVCPVQAISKGEKTYEINAETCVSCGQCAEECPSQAISEV